MKKNIMPLLSTRPEKGKNTVIVGHDDPFEAATGIYPEPQGVAYILNPNNQGSVRVIASLQPNEWKELKK